ncbi:hypothetical protein BGZ96_008765 [Linnemannia gamsii]|uniref:Peptidase S8/S53 domain-containing protein n=1 Tax=Linnemannia gamsii TaxID=64522 RepID=A0ABQ7JZQ8_9FUNG|nr:hypothetical protein BGZ96_008765 [Linnemannia gamsii]
MVLLSPTVLRVVDAAKMDIMNLPPSHLDRCPDAYLFEFTSEPGTLAAANDVNRFKALIASMENAHVRQEFDYILNGVSVHVPDEDELLELMEFPALLSVTVLTIVSAPKQVQPRQNAIVTSALNMTGVTRVHAELGLTGQGVKVGVIDTGIDYRHPAFGGCFGPGCRVAFGYDFVGDNYTGKNKPVPSGDPMDCAGHGSHVAGIVGASDEVVMGVAPKVTLGAYRVLGCNGSSSDDVIIAALERAAKDKMDVINLSIGEPNGWPGNPVSKAIDRMQNKGIMITVSQGNENTQGLFSTNYVSVGRGVLAVASFINTRALLTSFTIPQAPSRYFQTTAAFSENPAAFINPAGGTMSLFSSYGLDNQLHIKPDIGAPGENIYSTWPVKNGSYTTLSGTSMASPHLAGALALVIERLRNLDAKGLAGDSSSSPTSRKLELTASHIQRIYATFKNTAEPAYVFRNHASYDILADPDTKALGDEADRDPGVALPLAQRVNGAEGVGGGEGRVYIESVAKQGSGMVNIYRALTSFAHKMNPELAVSDETSGVVVPPISLTNVFPPILELNDTAAAILESSDRGGGLKRYITISNYGPNAVRYELSHISAEGLYELSIENKGTKLRNQDIYNATSANDKLVDDVIFSEARATVEFGNSQVILVPGGGGKKRVEVTIFPPTGIPEDQHWIYSGYIVVRAVGSESVLASTEVGEEASEGERADSNPAGDYSSSSSTSSPLPDTIHVSYSGVVGSMKTLPIFLRPTEEDVRANNQTGQCQMMSSEGNKTDFVYTFNGTDFPILTFCIQNPTQFIVMDLISAPPDGSEQQQQERDNNNNDPDGTIDTEDYKVLGRVASNENLGRSLVESIVTAVQFDGTLDLGDGDGKNRSREFVGMGESTTLRRRPGLDLVYGMRPQPLEESGGSPFQSQASKDQTLSDVAGERDARLLERRSGLDTEKQSVVIRKAPHADEDTGSADSNNNNNDDNNSKITSKSKKKSRKEASEADDAREEGNDEEAQARNDRLLRNNKKKARLAAPGADPSKIELVVPNGRYRLRIRALRMLGDPEKVEGYDYWITRTFTIQRLESLVETKPATPPPTALEQTP